MCIRDSPQGVEKRIEGKAWVADSQTNSKLKVRFFWPFSGDYWIVDLDEDYQWAIVGEQSRTLGWILSRNPVISTELYEKLKNKMQSVGYDTARLNKCQQIHSTNPQQ
eukprot:TRINITY_DN813_c0_g1_i12.p1 TRINITY_DN813_c0_g1~~TRINITY_DN813_c0_g1_i12.p1  ORF type:complete len:108 (+),score=19.41 TRINITY_DN813_c0_g1_i12:66-389(+)